jgi:hypothetical protein
VVNTPYLRPDRSLCATPGYDEATGRLYRPQNQIFSAIPDRPTKADAKAAIILIDDLIDSFPFVGAVDRAVALSAIFTAIDRRSMATAPLHAFSAPVAGSGKSMLTDIAAMVSAALAPLGGKLDYRQGCEARYRIELRRAAARVGVQGRSSSRRLFGQRLTRRTRTSAR